MYFHFGLGPANDVAGPFSMHWSRVGVGKCWTRTKTPGLHFTPM